jgi:hypothetical protein
LSVDDDVVAFGNEGWVLVTGLDAGSLVGRDLATIG